MYKLGDILECSYLVPSLGVHRWQWKRVLAYTLVVEVVGKGRYRVRDIQGHCKREYRYFITDKTSGYRKIGNIWESSSDG